MQQLNALRIVGRNGTVSTSKAWVARLFHQRLGGLLIHPPLQAGEALIIARCNSIHTLFMKYPIDVLFCSADNRVVAIKRNILPFRFTARVRTASFVIEFATSPQLSEVSVGDVVEFDPPMSLA